MKLASTAIKALASRLSSCNADVRAARTILIMKFAIAMRSTRIEARTLVRVTSKSGLQGCAG
jgi:hypothetical protein